MQVGSKVWHIKYDGAEVNNVTVTAFDPSSYTFTWRGHASDCNYWAEYWCESPLGHIGMPCVFCGNPNTYYRLVNGK